MAKIRQASNQMSLLMKDNVVISSQREIEAHILDFYTNLYASDNPCLDNGIVNRVIPKAITDLDNSMLIKTPSMDEVRCAIFSMSASGSLGPDGFGGGFFQTFWDIVGVDVFSPVL